MDIKKIDVFTYSPQKGVKIKVGRLYTKDKKVTFTKTVDSTRHKMRIFDGYGIQKDVYDKHLRGKQGRIIIKERDTGKVLVASIKTWAEHHSGQNFGDGKQIFLSTKYMHNSDNFDREDVKEKEVTKDEWIQNKSKMNDKLGEVLRQKGLIK